MEKRIQPLHYRHPNERDYSLGNTATGQWHEYRECLYCHSKLRNRYDVQGVEEYGEDFSWQSWACLACGWWWYGGFPGHGFGAGVTRVAELHHTADVPNTLLEGLRELNREAGRLYKLNATQFEYFVGSVLAQYYACDVVHHGRSHDGGIDLFVLDTQLGPVPVQVKHHQRPGGSESVTLIRDFRGAMLLVGSNRGIVVTTAERFSRAAVIAAKPQPTHLVPQTVELVDCRRLLDIIGVLSANRIDNLSHLFEFNESTYPRPNSESRLRIVQEAECFRQIVESRQE